jgi:hypothetical protein
MPPPPVSLRHVYRLGIVAGKVCTPRAARCPKEIMHLFRYPLYGQRFAVGECFAVGVHLARNVVDSKAGNVCLIG